VYVIARVTTVAVAGCAFITRTDMGLRARHGDVQAHQREAAEVMIERNVHAPTLWLVALLATCAKFSAVDVLCTMTLVASRADFLLTDDRGMTGMAVDLDVLAGQRKLGIAIVIEFIGLPGARIVALAALGA
jgi:hypothetical protein